jgi:hypothetical protein
MDDGQKRELVKISYIIPEGDDYAGQVESLWAYSLGNHLYELQNIPFYAEHLNIEDVVFCEEPSDSLPVINRLIKWSGNRTLRVAFTDEAPDEKCIDIIWDLTQRNILYEIATYKGYMFNIEPENDYEWVLNFLKSKQEEGLLWLYEQSTT